LVLGGAVMTSETIAFRRILVALDASRPSLAALEAAANLAARLQADLAGLFIEDVDLINLAALPFSKDLPALSRTGRSLDPDLMQREIRCKAAVARRSIARAAEARHLQWTFRVVRGRVDAELLAAAEGTDLIAVGKSVRALSHEIRMGRTARAVAHQTHCSILFVAPGDVARDRSIAALYDGSEPTARSLAVAAQLAGREGGKLVVLVLAEAGADPAARERQAAELIRNLGVAAAIRPAGDLLRTLRAEGVGLVVLPSALVAGADETLLGALVEQSDSSILLIRC
jgi:nucleotide-binding universal stress UspA family protein